MTDEALGEQVEGFLRAITVYAARTDAVLETRALRTADPVVSTAEVVGALARALTRSGISVSFGRVWTPLPPGVPCGIGTRGIETEVAPLLGGLVGATV